MITPAKIKRVSFTEIQCPTFQLRFDAGQKPGKELRGVRLASESSGVPEVQGGMVT
jgi:hypothetical protein